jgi:dTDP-4-amino-4,6-dideoxygalactose transaminase
MAAGEARVGPSAAKAGTETLALNGGRPAVTVPPSRQSAILKWPQYGFAEKEALKAAIDLDAEQIYRYLPELEAKWRAFNQVPFCKSHCNGTSAMEANYFALSNELPPGTEIMVPSYQFFGAITPMRFFGFVPVFVDVNPRTATIDVEHAKKVITPKTRAVMAMHAWGLPSEMDHVNDFAKEHGLIVIEDCAHAHGASIQGKKVGNWSRLAFYSFQGSKTLPGIEGGMGIYHSREDYERAATFGHYEVCGQYIAGSPYAAGALAQDSPFRKYVGTGLGPKLRMHPLAAVLILKQLEGLDQRNAMIRRQVRQLNDRICQLPGLSEPVCRKDMERVYYNANVLFLDAAKAGMSREALVKALQAEGVTASVFEYPENHTYAIYSEPRWWHHTPDVPKILPGGREANSRAIIVKLFRQEAPEMVQQYGQAFEKVWAHREELAKI